MAYAQRFGLSRNSPLLNVEDENNNPATSIVEKNNAKAVFDKFPPNTGSNPHTLSQGTGDDSYWQKFKTAVSNPFDTIKVMGGFGSNQFQGDGNTFDSMKNLRLAHEAKDGGANVPDLDNNAMNQISSLIPYAMTAQTISDAASGDFTAVATKKLNKIPGFKKFVNAKTAKKAYLSYKGYKAAKGL